MQVEIAVFLNTPAFNLVFLFENLVLQFSIQLLLPFQSILLVTAKFKLSFWQTFVGSSCQAIAVAKFIDKKQSCWKQNKERSDQCQIVEAFLQTHAYDCDAILFTD